MPASLAHYSMTTQILSLVGLALPASGSHKANRWALSASAQIPNRVSVDR